MSTNETIPPDPMEQPNAGELDYLVTFKYGPAVTIPASSIEQAMRRARYYLAAADRMVNYPVEFLEKLGPRWILVGDEFRTINSGGYE